MAAVDYETYYQGGPGIDGERGASWRALSAEIKARHVVTLCQRDGIKRVGSVLEVGCGDGAVLAQLCRRRFGDRFVGVEVSHAAAKLAATRPEIDSVQTFDGNTLPFEDGAFELVLATHVLEHVVDPPGLLRELRRVSAGHVVIEVPVEANRAALRPVAVSRSVAAGHVQRFSRRDVRRLLADAGLEPRAELSDPLPRSVRVFQDGPALGTVKWAARALLSLSPGRGERWMTVHYAVLTR